MSDIDDDLLALAGGASEDEGSAGPSREGSESPRHTKKDSDRSKKSKRRARQDDSEEEGEA